MTPLIVRDESELHAVRPSFDGRTLALVPTMGALHEGHRSLIRAARAHAESVAVSIFVNPLQFGPGEDLDRYPRTLAADLEICAEDGVDLVFAPTEQSMYPREPYVTINAGELGTILEGQIRPGHFDGVLTVVMKLFTMMRPNMAAFGRKDAQQLALIRLMVQDLNLPVQIIECPIVREPDGLALSSRNHYLSEAERMTALALARALHAGGTMAHAGPGAVLRAAQHVLDEAGQATPPLELDYVTLVDPVYFTKATGGGPALLAIAARVGHTRLIDNLRLEVGHDIAALHEPSTTGHSG